MDAMSCRTERNIDHELKTDPEIFQAVWDGIKPWEVRFDDRGYEVGHRLWLRETKHTGQEMRGGAPLVYTGREVEVDVLYILRGPIYGLADGWCIMSTTAPILREILP